MKAFFRDNGLSLVLVGLFLVFVVGQALTGWGHYDEERREHGRGEVSLGEYLHTGAFGEAIFENWESEFLQMALYVVLTAMFFQRGSAESKDPDEKEAVKGGRNSPEAPGPVRKGGWQLALYSNSLAIAFAVLFLGSFAGHAYFGVRAVNEEAALHGLGPESLASYMGSAQFWFESLQNWQSEFLAILSIVVLSIWLRQKGSPESKPVEAPHGQTGG